MGDGASGDPGLRGVVESEVVLSGGTLNPVVRVGDTVRRPAGPWTATVHDLLRHVRAGGFELAPEPYGVDETGREVLSFIPGDTTGWSLPWPDWVRTDDLLARIGEASARYHRAVRDFRPEGVVEWRAGAAELGPSEIVCHHDLAPYNAVVADGELKGFIDWDLAGPGSAVSDLAFVAWQWVPLHGPFVTTILGWSDPPDRARRLRLLLDSYGLDNRQNFVDQVLSRIRYNREIMARKASEGDAAYAALVEQGHLAGMDEALGFVADVRSELQAAL